MRGNGSAAVSQETRVGCGAPLDWVVWAAPRLPRRTPGKMLDCTYQYAYLLQHPSWATPPTSVQQRAYRSGNERSMQGLIMALSAFSASPDHYPNV